LRDVVQHYWPWLAGVVLLLAGGFGLLRLAARPRLQVAAAGAVADTPAGNRQQRQAALTGLKQACNANNPQETARVLLQLAEAEWPADPPRNLEALAQRLAAGAGPLRELERVLYAAGDSAWQGDEIWQLCRNGLPAKHPEAAPAAPGLAPLYPDWDKRGS
jgi:hypothetical protein